MVLLTGTKLVFVTLLGSSLAMAVPRPRPNATVTPSRLSIELGGDVVVVAADVKSSTRIGGNNCTLTRVYASGGYALTKDKLGPDFKHCCSITVPATKLNDSAVVCHIPPGVVATEGNTTVSAAGGVFGYIRSFASFVPEFTLRPYVRETEGGLLVRIDRNLALREPVVAVQIPCGGPNVSFPLAPLLTPVPKSDSSDYGPFVEVIVPFDVSIVQTPCYSVVNITLRLSKLAQLMCKANCGAGTSVIARSRTFIRGAMPTPGSRATVWQVDHSSKGLAVDGRRLIAQGWFAGAYSHESAGLPPISRVPAGQSMGMNAIRKLG
jgi:hypothetical protein